MTELVDSILDYFSDDDDKRQPKPAKRTKQYRKKRPAVSVKASAPPQQHPVKSIARLSPKSRAYLLRRLGASPKPRNTVARTKKNLRALQKAIPTQTHTATDGDMDGFPEKALSEGYHFNNDAVDREVLEPNEEMASGMRSDSGASGYMTDSEDDAFGPEMKALAKQFSSVSTYSKFIKDGKQTEFGSYVVNNSDKPYIESGKIKNGKMIIKRQPRPNMMN